MRALRIALAAGRMLLRVLSERALDLLLLLSREVEAVQALHPVVIDRSTPAALLSLSLDRRLLDHLCRCRQRQRKSRKQGGQNGDFHGLIIAVAAWACLKAALG